MKLFLLILACCSLNTGFAQADTAAAPQMKQYWFVMVIKGKERDKLMDTAIINRLQAGHLANIERMAKSGRLNIAGPFTDNGYWRGIFIFDCPTREEVERLLANDPAIVAGRLDYEIHPLWAMQGAILK